jgi:hypothetical protein
VLLGILAAVVPSTAAAAATTGTLNGTVTDPDENPVEDVLVIAAGSFDIFSDVTDSSGFYSIPGLPPDFYMLFFVPAEDSGLSGYDYPTPIDVRAGITSSINVQLELAGGVSGTITGPGGVALPTVDVGLESEDSFVSDTTNINGDYSFTGLVPGTYTLSVLPPSSYGLAPTFVTPVEVVGGETLDVDVELVAGGTIAGVVTQAGGDPLPGVSIEAFGEASDDFAVSNLDGEYSFSGLAAGDYTVIFNPPEGSGLAPFIADPVTVTSGVVTPLDVELGLGATISGTLDIPPSAPPGSIGVFALSDSSTSLTFPEPDGSYALTELPADDYLILFDTMPGSGVVPEFYDDSLMPAGGDLVEAVAGAETSGIDGVLELCAPPFSDVETFDRFCVEINWLSQSGITVGFPDGTFRPEGTVTRQAMAAFLWRRAGSPPGPFPDPGFSDVPDTSPFATAIAWLADEGITEGYPDGTFHPNETVSRQAMAAFLWRDAGQPPVDPPGFCLYDDVCPGHPFEEAISWLTFEGIAGGFDDGTFRPGAAVSRQAMAAFLFRDQLRIDFNALFPPSPSPARPFSDGQGAIADGPHGPMSSVPSADTTWSGVLTG